MVAFIFIIVLIIFLGKLVGNSNSNNENVFYPFEDDGFLSNDVFDDETTADFDDGVVNFDDGIVNVFEDENTNIFDEEW